MTDSAKNPVVHTLMVLADDYKESGSREMQAETRANLRETISRALAAEREAGPPGSAPDEPVPLTTGERVRAMAAMVRDEALWVQAEYTRLEKDHKRLLAIVEVAATVDSPGQDANSLGRLANMAKAALQTAIRVAASAI